MSHTQLCGEGADPASVLLASDERQTGSSDWQSVRPDVQGSTPLQQHALRLTGELVRTIRQTDKQLTSFL